MKSTILKVLIYLLVFAIGWFWGGFHYLFTLIVKLPDKYFHQHLKDIKHYRKEWKELKSSHK